MGLDQLKEDEIENFSLDSLSMKDQVRWHMESTINNVYFSTVMLLMTIYSLFGDDLRQTQFPSSTDNTFFGLSSLALAMFAYEFSISIFVYDNYFNSFYFQLDFLACISVIPDIGWLWDIIQPSPDASQLITAGLNGLVQSSNGVNSLNSIGKAGRASRAAARATKIIRIIRMIRLINFIHKQKEAQMLQRKLKKKEEVHSEIEIPEESNLSNRLSDANNKRVISLILIMVFTLPLMDTSFWQTTQRSEYQTIQTLVDTQTSLKEVANMDAIKTVMRTQFILIQQQHGQILDNPTYTLQPIDVPLMQFKTDQVLMQLLFDDPAVWATGWQNNYTQTDVFALRSSEIIYFTYYQNTRAIFANQLQNQQDGQASLDRTFFVCVMLTLACYQFSNDNQTLVLNPIERMINQVKKVVKNPLDINRIKEEIDELDEDKKPKLTAMNAFDRLWDRWCGDTPSKKDKLDFKDQFETKILEASIQKLCNLLVLGVGKAGQDIIVSNISTNQAIDTQIKGHKTDAIFGQACIHNQVHLLKVFDEEIMMVINTVVHCIHMNVDIFSGFANKNTGDSQLMIWKLDEGDASSTQMLAEFCLMAFLKTLQDAAQNPMVLELEQMQQSKLDNWRGDKIERLDKFRVHLGLSVHKGFAIEGAIGSEQKIDASQISEDVLLTKKLESFTSMQKVQLLMTDQFVNMLSESSQELLRKIDRYSFGEQFDRPVEIQTFDGEFVDTPIQLQSADQEQTKLVPVSEDEGAESGPTQKVEDFINKVITLHSVEEVIRQENILLADNLDTLKGQSPLEVHRVLSKVVKSALGYKSENDMRQFKDLFSEGLTFMKDGMWKDAKKKFEEAMNFKKGDGPAQFLIDYMQEQAGSSLTRPEKWQGFRSSSDKK